MWNRSFPGVSPCVPSGLPFLSASSRCSDLVCGALLMIPHFFGWCTRCPLPRVFGGLQDERLLKTQGRAATLMKLALPKDSSVLGVTALCSGSTPSPRGELPSATLRDRGACTLLKPHWHDSHLRAPTKPRLFSTNSSYGEWSSCTSPHLASAVGVLGAPRALQLSAMISRAITWRLLSSLHALPPWPLKVWREYGTALGPTDLSGTWTLFNEINVFRNQCIPERPLSPPGRDDLGEILHWAWEARPLRTSTRRQSQISLHLCEKREQVSILMTNGFSQFSN